MLLDHFSRKAHITSILFMVTLLAVTFIAGCSRQKEPIRIGFIGTLTGKYADIGNDALIGVRIAIGEVNQKGGVGGRSIELLIKDDSGSPEKAITAAEQLATEGIDTIIGPNLSNVAVELVPWCDEHGLLLIAPTVSTSTLARLDDAMIRVFPYNEPVAGKIVANFISQNISRKSGVILYDAGNAAYTRDIVQYAEDAFAVAGLPVVSYPFLADEGFDYGAMIDETLTPEDGFIYIVAAAMDTAMFSWQIKKQGLKPQLIFNHWAISDELYRIGNVAIEDAIFLTGHFPVESSAALSGFKKKVAEHTTRTAYKFMIYGYEATQLLIQGVEMDSSNLKQAILDIGTFQGLQYEYSIDRYGDVRRPYFAIEIKNGAAVPFSPTLSPVKGATEK
ncbi:MAG: ABC transporter substrate-binding protein [Thermodesulfobacteriota bacterium]|nr:ABC transporter substrate-binding protein [Thermodesulfobacteriota bacterium]